MKLNWYDFVKFLYKTPTQQNGEEIAERCKGYAHWMYYYSIWKRHFMTTNSIVGSTLSNAIQCDEFAMFNLINWNNYSV